MDTRYLIDAVVGMIVNGFVLGPEAAEEKGAAFESYDTDLLTRLRMQRRTGVEDVGAK